MKKKLTCHCGEFVAEVNIPDAGINKIMRCNCTLCKRKGYVIGVLGENDFKIVKGENLLKLYQYTPKMLNIISVLYVEFIHTIDQE